MLVCTDGGVEPVWTFCGQVMLIFRDFVRTSVMNVHYLFVFIISTDLRRNFQRDPVGGKFVVGDEIKLECNPPKGEPQPESKLRLLFLK